MSKNTRNKEAQTTKLNYYEVFGLEKTATKKEIIAKYRDLVKKYHPDKNPLNSKIFELIQRAWECLGNDEKRKEYDGTIKEENKIRENNFIAMKKKFEEYNELINKDLTDENKKKALIEYNRQSKLKDEEMGYNREKQEEKLSREDMTEKVDNFKFARDQEELENEQCQIFEESEEFDIDKFNTVYEKYMTKKNNRDIIIKPLGPSAYNRQDYGDIYSLGGEKYAEEEEELNIDCDNINNYSVEDFKYIKIDKNRKETSISVDKLKEIMAAREKETEELNHLSLDKFINDKDKSFTFTNEVELNKKISLDKKYLIEDEELLEASKELLKNN
jgi:curved DNA-binding protein CbpA